MNNSQEQFIFLIEDSPGDNMLINELLKEITTFHYKLIFAETLKEGCKQIKNNLPILILLDLNLPDSMGKETFDTIIKYADQIPVVLVSERPKRLNLKNSIHIMSPGRCAYLNSRNNSTRCMK